MKRLIALLFLIIASACNRNPAPVDLQANLKSTMVNYLYSTVKYDSSKVRYAIVDDVIYFDDKTWYICDFKVKMTLIEQQKDTVGTMRAYVSKDFKEVKDVY
ncbi:hypothetical protein BH10BAC2_BH10BAC2_32250 [soil metagenome]